MESRYSLRSPAVKRLMKEAQELREATETYYAHPLEDNLFEWHFTIRGPQDTEFDGGIYHGRIILPPDYPMKPPSIILLTPNGRFETFKKICLSISGHHPESWQPSWSIRTALLAIIGFMPTHGNGAIGSLDYSSDERKVLAKRSAEFKCSTCGPISCILKPVTEASKESNKEAKELAQQINFQGEKEKKAGSDSSSGSTETSGATTNNPETTTTASNHSNMFQQFNAAGAPFPMMPPQFMNPLFRPPTTSSGVTPAIPPQMFMPPPFWPNNVPPTTQPGQWPYNPSVTSASTEVTSSETSPTSLSASQSSSSSTTTQAEAVATPVSETPNTTSTSTPATGVRQRVAATQPRIQRTLQNAELRQQHRQPPSGGSCTLGLIIIIGLALVVLIIRRLIIMELLSVG